MTHRHRGWREWAEFMLNTFPHDKVGWTHFGRPFEDDRLMTGTVAERALYAYFMFEVGEPF